MSARGVLSDYLDEAMRHSVYEKLEDGMFAGSIEGCTGLLAFAESESEAWAELRSVLEGWVLLGLKHRHHLPQFAGIDLNGEPALEPVDSL